MLMLLKWNVTRDSQSVSSTFYWGIFSFWKFHRNSLYSLWKMKLHYCTLNLFEALIDIHNFVMHSENIYLRTINQLWHHSAGDKKKKYREPMTENTKQAFIFYKCVIQDSSTEAVSSVAMGTSGEPGSSSWSQMKQTNNVHSDSSDSDEEVAVSTTFTRKISTNKRLDKSVSRRISWTYLFLILTHNNILLTYLLTTQATSNATTIMLLCLLYIWPAWNGMVFQQS